MSNSVVVLVTEYWGILFTPVCSLLITVNLCRATKVTS